MRRLGGLLVMVCASAVAGAQTIPGAVLAVKEPHHHLAYEDSVVRVLRVEVPAKDSTLLHEHATDYFWIALGASEVVNARLGGPVGVVSSEDRSVHYTPGRFAHVARNPGTTSFRNITVELLRGQSRPRNRCEEAVAGADLMCTSARVLREVGVLEKPAFETDQLQVGLVTFAPGAQLAGNDNDPQRWYILLNPLDGNAVFASRDDGGPLATRASKEWRGGTWTTPLGRKWRMANRSQREITMLEVTAVRK